MSLRYSINKSEVLISDKPKLRAGISLKVLGLRGFSFFLLGIFLLIVTPLQAEVESDKSTGLKGPTVITASMLSADGNTNTALFEGSVIAKNNEMTLYSDRMMVYYTANNEIDRIDAEQNVKLVKKDRVVTSEKATYFAKEQKIVFVGKPRAVEGQNVVTGSKMTYLIEEDRSIVENSKVYLRHDSTEKDDK
jgi:lipopolysaccharide export system protein LptA